MKPSLKIPFAAAFCFMIMAVTSLAAAPPKKDHEGKGREGNEPARPATEVRVVHEAQPRDMYFSVEHVRVIREYYAPRAHRLPPGLQKKYERTGHLPPGWEQRMEPMPVAIERDLPRLPDGYRRGVIDGHAVVYNSRAGTIIDVAVIF